jgi:hypothetical protein
VLRQRCAPPPKSRRSAPSSLEAVSPTHLFEEAGALEQVSTLAADWLGSHLDQARAGRTSAT